MSQAEPEAMTAASDIVERLRTAIKHDENGRSVSFSIPFALFEEAAAEIERLRAALDQARAEALEQAKSAALSMRYGPPSSWHGKNPGGWHLYDECTPRDASMHDNGCIDAASAIMALRKPVRTLQGGSDAG